MSKNLHEVLTSGLNHRSETASELASISKICDTYIMQNSSDIKQTSNKYFDVTMDDLSNVFNHIGKVASELSSDTSEDLEFINNSNIEKSLKNITLN